MLSCNSVSPFNYVDIVVELLCSSLYVAPLQRKNHASISIIIYCLNCNWHHPLYFYLVGSLLLIVNIHMMEDWPIQTTYVVSWNAMMIELIEHGCFDETLNCFEMMELDGIFPDSITFICGLLACRSKGAIDKGWDLHSWIINYPYLVKWHRLSLVLSLMIYTCWDGKYYILFVLWNALKNSLAFIIFQVTFYRLLVAWRVFSRSN